MATLADVRKGWRGLPGSNAIAFLQTLINYDLKSWVKSGLANIFILVLANKLVDKVTKLTRWDSTLLRRMF